MEKLWNWLNGNKTTIGAILMGAAQVLRLTGSGEWAEVLDKFAETLQNVGFGVASIGLAHKVEKKISGG